MKKILYFLLNHKNNDMKKVTMIIAILLSVTSIGQSKKDTAWIPASDSAEFINTRDINEYLAPLYEKVSAKDFNLLKAGFQEIINNAVARKRKELTSKNK